MLLGSNREARLARELWAARLRVRREMWKTQGLRKKSEMMKKVVKGWVSEKMAVDDGRVWKAQGVEMSN